MNANLRTAGWLLAFGWSFGLWAVILGPGLGLDTVASGLFGAALVSFLISLYFTWRA